MQVEYTYKSLKQMFTKYLAVLVSICYLLNPLHQQISNVLHTISHRLESPTHLIVPLSTSLEETDKMHTYLQHQMGHEIHEHHFLDFFEMIFVAVNNQDEAFNDTSMTEIGMDKHLSNYAYASIKHFLKTTHFKSFYRTQDLLNGFPLPHYNPPQKALVSI